jgi:hypothetical protein
MTIHDWTSGSDQSHRLSNVLGMSASSPTPAISLQRGELALRANSCRQPNHPMMLGRVVDAPHTH